MVNIMKRFEIQVLRKARVAISTIALQTGVSERTIRRVAAEPAVVAPDAPTPKPHEIGRPSKADPFRKLAVDLLVAKPDLMTLEVLRLARLAGYTGGKTAMYDLIGSIRTKVERPLVRFDGLPGEFTQHDFGHVDVRFIDGTTRRIHFFASRLKYSRWVQVTIVQNEQVETLVRTLVEHFAAMGGVPLLAVFDRPKTVAISWRKDGEVTEWNSTFAYVILELGVGAEVCWPARGQEKGAVENLVGWVKGSFFKQRRFLDDADLLQQLSEWEVEVNTKTPSRATGVTPAARMEDEKKRLRPLKVSPASLALRMPVQVGPTAKVLHDTHTYSMPADAIGIAGTLYLYRDRVRIVAGRHTAEHPRQFARNADSTLPEHRTDLVAAVSGKRGKRYLKRQHLLETGAAAMEYLTEITHRRPRDWTAEVERLHELLQRHGAVALAVAFRRAVTDRTIGVEYIEHYLRGYPDVSPPSEVSSYALPGLGISAEPAPKEVS